MTADCLLDTSAAVPLIVASHEAHEATLDALDGLELGLAGHAWFETFSVLTRLPPPARRGPADVLAILQRNFPSSHFLSDSRARELTERLVDLGVAGGAVYDALVGAAAAECGLRLFSRDGRAAELYRRIGVDTVLLA